MIGAFEQHLANWLADRLTGLATEPPDGNPLFRAVKPLPGETDPGELEDGETGLLVAVDRLESLPEKQQVGMATVDRPRALRLRATARLRLLGPAAAAPVSATSDIEIDPQDARFAGVDLDLLLVLDQLEERLAPRFDGAAAGRPDAARGWVSASAVGRRVELRWDRLELSEIRLEGAGERRGWSFDLAAELSFRLEPVELEGGRILDVPATMHADPGAGG